MNSWEEYTKEQKEICSKYNMEWVEANPEFKIGIAENVFSKEVPINGLRHPIENQTTGWYIYAGESFSKDDNFFKPYCVKHLLKLKPELLKYLGLPPGSRFLINYENYEDVWEDFELLKI